MNPSFEQFQKQILHPIKFKFFLLQKLPAAFFAGLRIHSFDEEHTVITVKYNWLNQNPFRSMYFAVQSMAAEMSSGLMASAQVYKRNPAVSMLVVKFEASFIKKAVDTISFTCRDGSIINEAIERSILTGLGETIVTKSVGTNKAGEAVSEFLITWSFKAKTPLSPAP